jgi:DNA-binding SARP family transcriptional activator
VTTGLSTGPPPAISDDRALGAAVDLLDRGRYEEAAELVGALERACEAAGDVVAAEILAAARRLCLACRHHRRQVEASARVARPEAGLEGRLRACLHTVLDLAAATSLGEASATAPAARTAPAGPRGDEPGVLAIQCLGPFAVYDGDRKLVPWPNRRAKSLFKYLVVHRGRPVAKDLLMEIFWPDAGFSAARNNLHVTVHALRRFLRQAHADVSHVLFQDGCYALDPALPLWVDAEEFTRMVALGHEHDRRGRHAEAVRDLQAAEELYQGGLFDDDPYEEWMLPKRRELQDAFVSVLERLREVYLTAGDHRAAVELSRRILGIEPYREDAHRDLMRAYARHGQYHLALRQFLDCAVALHETLDAKPDDETVELYERIRRREPV